MTAAYDFDEESPEETAALDKAAEVAAGVTDDVHEPIDITAMSNRAKYGKKRPDAGSTDSR